MLGRVQHHLCAVSMCLGRLDSVDLQVRGFSEEEAQTWVQEADARPEEIHAETPKKRSGSRNLEGLQLCWLHMWAMPLAGA